MDWRKPIKMEAGVNRWRWNKIASLSTVVLFLVNKKLKWQCNKKKAVCAFMSIKLHILCCSGSRQAQLHQNRLAPMRSISATTGFVAKNASQVPNWSIYSVRQTVSLMWISCKGCSEAIPLAHWRYSLLFLGYRVAADCSASGQPTKCEPCQAGQYMEVINYSENCRGCSLCPGKTLWPALTFNRPLVYSSPSTKLFSSFLCIPRKYSGGV